MKITEKYIVVPFRKAKGGAIIPGEMRQASTEALAERLAESMSKYHLGASAIAVLVNEDGDMTSPRLICEFGQAVDLIEGVAA